jgi:hypothetical protein
MITKTIHCEHSSIFTRNADKSWGTSLPHTTLAARHFIEKLLLSCVKQKICPNGRRFNNNDLKRVCIFCKGFFQTGSKRGIITILDSIQTQGNPGDEPAHGLCLFSIENTHSQRQNPTEMTCGLARNSKDPVNYNRLVFVKNNVGRAYVAVDKFGFTMNRFQSSNKDINHRISDKQRGKGMNILEGL